MCWSSVHKPLPNSLHTIKYAYPSLNNAVCCPYQATHEEIESIMIGWTEQVGYPVININTTTGEIVQEQFLLKRAEDTG